MNNTNNEIAMTLIGVDSWNIDRWIKELVQYEMIKPSIVSSLRSCFAKDGGTYGEESRMHVSQRGVNLMEVCGITKNFNYHFVDQK